jgi:hypothetical protein
MTLVLTAIGLSGHRRQPKGVGDPFSDGTSHVHAKCESAENSQLPFSVNESLNNALDQAARNPIVFQTSRDLIRQGRALQVRGESQPQQNHALNSPIARPLECSRPIEGARLGQGGDVRNPSEALP